MPTDPFDDKAATWDADPAKVARAATVARAITESIPVDRTTRVLEYGAGTGLVSQALASSVGPITLADASEGMRQVMHAKVASGELGGARVWALNLESDPPPDEQFDLIVTVLVLHHVRDLPRVLAGFARLLAPGGRLCIADLEREDGTFHGADFDGHHGFDRIALAADLEAAGFAEVRFADCTSLTRDGATYPVFLATAARA